MKETELMIGDWVTSIYDKRALQINVIDSFKKCVCLDHRDWVSVDNLQPIPLTGEILEKNGFEWRAYGVVLAGEDMALVQCGDYWKIKPNQYSNDTFCYIWYVHELQHALRLCGIDKEIVL